VVPNGGAIFNPEVSDDCPTADRHAQRRTLSTVLTIPVAKILVVEDFEQFRRFIVSTLQRSAKFQITEASNGLEALQRAEEHRPDLVLLDIGLPDLNGIDVARRLRKLGAPPKIVFISQESSPEVVGEALHLGALGYVHKTRAGSDLLPAVEAALEGERFVSSGLEKTGRRLANAGARLLSRVAAPSMGCCIRYCAAEEQFGTKLAERDLRRYRQRGVTGITRVMLAELRSWPLEDSHLLDVGGGIGTVGAELAASGLASATFVEASPSYLETARQVLESRFAPRQTEFVLGDFVALVDRVAQADVVTLDRVVCCYPDDKALLEAAAARTRRLVALTYPRNRWYVRVVVALQNVLRRLQSKNFRVFVHGEERIRATLEAAGLSRTVRKGTLVWTFDLYCRR
jgi:DNA-binding NarL/FixJ family response regulator/2-polyprenyl-3-methyl-5-hydroxy-6-metoxy-1,4-benzoquinol methylase